jgi:acetyltransferase-like isoleucine patch superfamily enzyme
MIKARKISVPDSTIIGQNVKINCDTFILGENCYIGNNVRINCNSFNSGDYLYLADGVEVGRGGSYGPNSIVSIGHNVGIFESTIINPSESVTIGNNSGIGSEVMIWTHGAWLDIFDGFPASFGPVVIEQNVWLPARSIVLPNVTIGMDTVIAINTVINRSVPRGSLAGGNPVKVIKGGFYPKKLPRNEKINMLEGIIEDWKELLKTKTCPEVSTSVTNNLEIILEEGDSSRIIFELEKKPYNISGDSSAVSEDLRDYLRRRGIKIYNGNRFQSIKSDYVQD